MLDVLSGETTLAEALRPTALQDSLYLLTTGGRPANPGELVTSEAFREMLATLKSQFDYVLIDSPPVLPVSDPATIASLVDGVYMVTRIRKGVKADRTKSQRYTRFRRCKLDGYCCQWNRRESALQLSMVISTATILTTVVCTASTTILEAKPIAIV